MIKTKWTTLISVRIDTELLEKIKEDVLRKKNEGLRRTTLSSLIQDILYRYYYKR